MKNTTIYPDIEETASWLKVQRQSDFVSKRNLTKPLKIQEVAWETFYKSLRIEITKLRMLSCDTALLLEAISFHDFSRAIDDSLFLFRKNQRKRQSN